MGAIIWVGIAIIIIIALATRLYKKPSNQNPPQRIDNTPQQKEKTITLPTIYKYQKIPYLLTTNENYFYQALLPIATKMNLTICPKVRLADIIEPQKGQNWKAAFNKIQSKHIDFLLCKNPLSPMLAIELDDNSHKNQNRKERDSFIDKALNTAGIPILHTAGHAGVEEKIKQILAQNQPHQAGGQAI